MVVEDKILEVNNISFSYEDNLIFENISFSIKKGDVLCILGPNGTGKTTLIKCLNGLHDTDSGEILVNGENIKTLSFSQISKHIGYIPQSHIPSFPFTVFDVVLMGRAPYLNLAQSPKAEDEKIAVKSLKTLGIYDLKDKEYTNLSGGERQLVFLARVLTQQPDILILDEPTRGIDVGAKYEIYCIINDLVEAGKSVIMISSELPEVLGMSDRIYVMNAGKIVGELDAKEATQEKIMSHILKSGEGE